MPYKRFNRVLPVLLLSVALLSGCKKKITPVQQKQQAITTSNDFYNTFSSKYQKELGYLSSGKKKSHINRKIIEYVANKKYESSFTDFLFPRLKAEYIPVHTYLTNLDQDIKKLEMQEKHLSKIGDFKEAQDLKSKIKNLTIDLFEIKLILSKSRDFREESRYLNLVR
jgi:hypothetical protein